MSYFGITCRSFGRSSGRRQDLRSCNPKCPAKTGRRRSWPPRLLGPGTRHAAFYVGDLLKFAEQIGMVLGEMPHYAHIAEQTRHFAIRRVRAGFGSADGRPANDSGCDRFDRAAPPAAR